MQARDIFRRVFVTLKNQSIAKTILLNLALAVVYFFVAKLGLLLATLNHMTSPVWPATGFAFSIVYLFGRRVWWAVALGAFAANFFTGGLVGSAIAISIGNTLEALVGASIIHWVLCYRKQLTDQTETIAFLVAAVLGSIVSASIGVTALYLFEVISKDVMTSVWITWWIGDMLGGLVVTPVLIQLRKISFQKINWYRIVSLVCCMSLVAYFVFFVPIGSSYVFLLFPILLYSVHCLGGISTLLISMTICILSIAATVNGVGPFATGTLNERLVHLQLFLAAFTMTSLTLSGFGKEKLSRLPTIVLMGCWALSGVIFYSFDQSERSRTEAHFADLVGDTQEKILTLMKSYEDSLRGGVGLFFASKSVEADEWTAYSEALKITEDHSGMNGIGVVWPVMARDFSKFTKKIRAQGIRDFSIKPVPGYEFNFNQPNQLHYVVKFIEPYGRNLRASGLDIGSEPNRRSAAENARDTGLATMTSKIVLVQDQQKLPGFLFYLPIYKRNAPLLTADDRKKAHLGWIFGPIIYQKFFTEVFNQQSNEIEVQAFEEKNSVEDLVFTNFSKNVDKPENQRVTDINIGQRNFKLKWRKSPTFISSHDTVVAWVGFCGAIASLLLTNLMISLQSIGQRAREIAQELTKELNESREKFEEGERRLLYALDGSDDGIWDWNMAKSEMYVSGKMATTHGWPQKFYVKTEQDLQEWAHPDDLIAIGRSIKEVLLGRTEAHEVETRYRTVNGDWRWVLTRGKVSERDKEGRPTRMTGVHIDIHKLKEAQKLLENTQNQLRNIANSVPTKISLWDSNLKCLFANRLFGKWFGQDVEQLIGKNIQNLMQPAEFSDRLPLFQRVLQGENLVYEREAIRPFDGAKRFIVVTFLPNKNNDVVEGFFLFIQDITNLKKAELNAIREQKIAEEATSVKSQFLANMSHEIRTPLNGIIGMSNLLKRTTLSHQQREYSEIIGRSSDSLLNIVNDVLDFSKAEAGKLELEQVDFNLNNLIRDVARVMSFSAQDKGLAIVVNTDFKSHENFKGDSGRIRQILNNLMSNAIKFTSQGTVTVKLEAIEQGSSSLLKFKIIDNGIGIPDQALDRMFQSFSQADATMSRRFGGSGLGLSICKQLVHLMGGEIGVESSYGNGSTFWFNLNLPHGSFSEKKAKSSILTKRTLGARILVAEDNRVNQQIALETLTNLGYLPHAVGNGHEVLETLRDLKFDLILMDCQMPEMDGFEATSIIRKSETLNFKNIPIVAMTANVLDGDIEKCLSVGMNDHVSKPINEQHLVATIEKYLANGSSNESVSMTDHLGHILVVEDNQVNQNVICLNLEALGYTFDVAPNGLIALNNLSTKMYDLVLMDCQMPEMDGYEATQRIRSLSNPKVSGIPIIALTANAMKGDQDRCHEVGMNDYLTKPIDMEALSQVIKKWMKAPRLKESHMENAKNSSVIDMTSIEKLRKLQKPGRPNLLVNLINLFNESAEQGMSQIRMAVKSNDMKSLSEAAHSLKSSAANLGALHLSSLCLEIEKIGDGEVSSEGIDMIVARLEEEYTKVLNEFGELKVSV